MRIIYCFLICCLLFACTGEDNGGSVKSPYKPVSEKSTTNYKIQRLSGDTAIAVIKYGGQVNFNNGTYSDFVASYTIADGEKKTHIYGKMESSTRATFAGYSVDYPEGASNTDYTVTLDSPVTVDAERIKVQEEKEMDLSGKITFADNRSPINVKVKAKYKKLEDNAIFDSEFGTLSGVYVFEGSALFVEGEGWAPLDLLKGKTVEGKVWFHPTFGILKIDIPEWKIGASMKDQYDCGDISATDYNTIQKVQVVSKDNPVFSLSNYECSNEFDADKMRHAKMLVELRWADREKAKTQEQPLLDVTFGTAIGYFPHRFISATTSIFHPEENGQGYTYWYAYVDEAAKNEIGENGIYYGITAKFTSNMKDAVRVTARIRYPIYKDM